MEKTKICTRCKIEKDRSKFRIRKKRGFDYHNASCRDCDNQIASEYYWKKKNNDPEFIQKNRDRVNEYRKKYPEKYKQQKKNRRQQDSYKEYVKKYYQKNHEKIIKQHRIVCNRYVERNRERLRIQSDIECKRARTELTDYYVRGQIKRQNTNLDSETINRLIPEKKMKIIKHRIISTLSKIQVYEKEQSTNPS